MHPRLREDASIGTFTLRGSSETRYFVENKRKKLFEISYHVYRELLRADGTHPLDIPRSLQQQLKRDRIITTSRYIYNGLISRFILILFGKKIARFRPVCRWINRLLPILAVLLFTAAIFLKQRDGWFGSADLNIPLVYLMIILSLAVHEYAHLIAGLAYGFRCTQMGLLLLVALPIGAYVVHWEKKSAGRMARFQTSLAGIEANVLLAAIFLMLSAIDSSLDTTLATIAIANILLAFLNLLPASGLDGESALSALLGIRSLSEYSKLFFKNKAFRKNVLGCGIAGYGCAVVFAIERLTSVFVGILIALDALILILTIFL